MDDAAPAAGTQGCRTRRCVALAIDLGLAQTIGELGGSFLVLPGLRPLVTLLPGVVLFVYWAASELWLGPGTTPAKWALGLRVVDANGERAGARAVLVRALVMAVVFGFDAYAVLGLVTGGRVPQSLQFLQAGIVLAYVACAVMAIASRRDAAWPEDRWSATRVIRGGAVPAGPAIAPGPPAPRHGRVVLLGALAIALAAGIVAAGGPGLSRLWRPADPKLEINRIFENLIARRVGILSDVTTTNVAHWRTGSPTHHVAVMDVSVPWSAFTDANVSAIYTALIDTIQVDPRRFDRIEIRIGSALSGLVRLHKSLVYSFDYFPDKGLWAPAPADTTPGSAP